MSVAHSQITLHTTYLYDPFPDMLKWLENIASGQQISEWYVDEENTSVDLVYTTMNDQQGVLVATDCCDQDRQLKVSITPDQLVHQFYQSFRTFASSPRYHPDEWQTSPDLPPDFESQFGTDLRALRSLVIEEWLNR